MQYLPIFAGIEGQACLVVGGDGMAARKLELLRRAGAQIDLLADAPCDELQLLLQRQQIGSARLPQQIHDWAHYRLIVIAEESTQAEDWARQALAAGFWVNSVDKPAFSNFIFPSIIDRSPLMVAISSSGQAPVLARMLRAKLESLIPARLGRLAALVGQFRAQSKAVLTDSKSRRVFWEQEMEGRLAELVYAGKEREAAEHLQQRLQQVASQQPSIGEVFLVGAGPGDPDLLTFRALRLMQKADIVVYDRLVSQEVLDLTRRDAERIHVGKARAQHTMPQEEINQLLLRLAQQGNKVLRLKGGDPFIFGRGGEEIETLMAEGIPFQVVPGITAASGCASYAGIPLTHRDHAQSVTFVTGHLKDDSCDLNWPALAQPNQTVVFYMGLVGLPEICRQLQAHGLAASHPIALVQQGTTRHQKVLVATLESIVERAAAEEIKPPTLIIVGQVVQLQPQLDWFKPDQLPAQTGGPGFW